VGYAGDRAGEAVRRGGVVTLAALVAHEVNRAYCQSIGDDSQLEWHEAEDWQRRGVIDGAEAVARGAIETPGDSHRSWMAEKEREGWVWGPVKDAERKEHPCMVPFEELPPEQQAKDRLFLAAVRAVLDYGEMAR
jgi:hypothetical protein